MKILHVDINNVRSYKELSVDLSPNLTVLCGESDSGKSSFIKALIFNILNYAPKNTRTKNVKEISSVSISDGTTSVIRSKDDSANYYSVEIGKDKKEYTALGKNIPFEIGKALNLSDVNIQQQKETYFLIDKSNGVISKKLNEVSGLSEIDRTIKSITTAINTLSSDIREKNNNIAEDLAKIADTEWTDKADIDLNQIENLDTEISLIEMDYVVLQNYIKRYYELREKLKNLIPSSIIDDFTEISNIDFDIEDKIVEIRGLQAFINNFEIVKQKHDAIEDIDPSEFSRIFQEIEVLKTDIKTLDALIKSFSTHQKLLSVIDSRIAGTETEMSKFKLCPTCKRPL